MQLPPVLALGLTLAFIFFLFRRESRKKSNVSGALWIPLIWLLITGSRAVSQWQALSSVQITSPEDGSPVDGVVFLTLIVAGCIVLQQRGVNLSTFARSGSQRCHSSALAERQRPSWPHLRCLG